MQITAYSIVYTVVIGRLSRLRCRVDCSNRQLTLCCLRHPMYILRYVMYLKWVFLAVPGKLSFASYFSDEMVLQRSPQAAIVWGYCTKPGQNITVTVSGRQPVGAFSVDYPDVQGGVWSVSLSPEDGPGPVTIEATDGHDSVRLSGVLFGDVWICSGQSNMEFTLDMVGDHVTRSLVLVHFNSFLCC